MEDDQNPTNYSHIPSYTNQNNSRWTQKTNQYLLEKLI